MARAPRSLKKQIEDLIDDFVPEIRDAFLAAIADIVDRAILKNVIEAISEGNAAKAFEALGFSNAAMRPLIAAIERAFEAGGLTTAASFPKRLGGAANRVIFRFDTRNSRAEKWLRDHSGELITHLKTDALANVQNVMFEGIKAGNNPRTTALDIVGRINPVTRRREGGIIGLTPNQERWVSNTRRELDGILEWRANQTGVIDAMDHPYFSRKLRDKRFDAIVRKAIDADKPLGRDVVDKLVGRYKDRALKYRADTIGRTEAMLALNRAEYETTKQLVDSGAVPASAVGRVWDSAGDDGRTRSSHLKMDGQRVGIDEPFITPNGDKLMYPGDGSLGAPADETIQCRCRVRLNVDWLHDVV